jgi:hypothetical protein
MAGRCIEKRSAKCPPIDELELGVVQLAQPRCTARPAQNEAHRISARETRLAFMLAQVCHHQKYLY